MKFIYRYAQKAVSRMRNLGSKLLNILQENILLKKTQKFFNNAGGKLFGIILKKDIGPKYFFTFLKVAVVLFFIVGLAVGLLRKEFNSILPLHASGDKQVVAEKNLDFSSAVNSQEYLSARHLSGLDDANGYSGTGGSLATTMPTSQGSAFLWQNAQIINTETLNGERNQIRRYVVRQGDTPSGIASSFGLSLNTLLWANDLSSTDYIQPGDELIILSTDGLIYEVKYGDTISKIASDHKVEVSKILETNDIARAEHIVAGQQLILPGGVRPAPTRVVASSSPRTTPASSLQSISGYFIRPTSGYISQRLHGYNAVDIAGGCWQPVYAAASGRVSIAVGNGLWNGGFGNYVKINHPNGTGTLYAHFIQVTVSTGQSVNQGALIGYTGSTGRSSGCHLHWEVHGARNPLG